MKEIFDKYRALVKSQERAPILFFNEADAIFGNRMENTQRSVDKMENAIQNIILQEMEQLDGIMIYPDFTIRHPKTGETFYWEHFSLMDNPTYSKNACSKLQHYISSGIIPSIQLITTYETKDNPLSAEKVEKIVEEYFL